MATFTKLKLSSSTNGKPIAIAATATPGTAIHTGDVTKKQELWLYAVNVGSNNETLTIEWGGTTAAEQVIVEVKATRGLILVLPGILLDAGSVAVAAFASTTNVINVSGWIHEIA